SLAHAVAAEERRASARRNVERDVTQDVAAAVVLVDARNSQHAGHPPKLPSPQRPQSTQRKTLQQQVKRTISVFSVVDAFFWLSWPANGRGKLRSPARSAECCPSSPPRARRPRATP